MASLIDIMRPFIDRYGIGPSMLNLLYSKPWLRQEIASILHHEQLDAGDPRCKWGRFRLDLLAAAGIDETTWRSRADADYQFEALVNSTFTDLAREANLPALGQCPGVSPQTSDH